MSKKKRYDNFEGKLYVGLGPTLFFFSSLLMPDYLSVCLRTSVYLSVCLCFSELPRAKRACLRAGAYCISNCYYLSVCLRTSVCLSVCVSVSCQEPREPARRLEATVLQILIAVVVCAVYGANPPGAIVSGKDLAAVTTKGALRAHLSDFSSDSYRDQ